MEKGNERFTGTLLQPVLEIAKLPNDLLFNYFFYSADYKQLDMRKKVINVTIFCKVLQKLIEKKFPSKHLLLKSD